MRVVLFLLCLGLAGCACSTEKAARKYSEKWYEQKFNAHIGGKSTRLKDGTICDSVTDEYAIEVDFARKWYEAVGQSLHYSTVTGKKPGILLIMESIKDRKYLERLKIMLKYHSLSIKVWTIDNKEIREL